MRSDQPHGDPAAPSSDGHMPRRTVVGGLIGAIASIATRAPAVSQERIPSFQSGRYQFTILRPQKEMPSITLFRLDGKTTDLASLRGKPILLNFWATWCAACRTELPILDRLEEQHRGGRLRVIAVSEDRADHTTVSRFVQSLKIRNLPIYWDPDGYVAFSDRDNRRNAPFALYGMPMTYLIAGSGRVVGYMPGAADWTSEGAQELLDYLYQS